MDKTVEVDFSLLESDIEKLRKIRNELKKPKYPSKLDLVKTGSQGDVLDSIFAFTTLTEKYYEAVSLLIDNTISFLENSEKALKKADDVAAKQIKEK